MHWSIMVIPVSLSHFNVWSVFSLGEYGSLGDVFRPVHIKGISSFNHLLLVLNNRQRPHMYVQEAGHQGSACKFCVLVCSLTHTSLCHAVSLRSSCRVQHWVREKNSEPSNTWRVSWESRELQISSQSAAYTESKEELSAEPFLPLIQASG